MGAKEVNRGPLALAIGSLLILMRIHSIYTCSIYCTKKKKKAKNIYKNKSSLDTEQIASGLRGFCPFDQRSARCLELAQRCGATERRRKQPVHLGWIGILPQRFERAPARLCVEQEVGAFWLLLVRERA
jgi:hypothetical protein